MQSGVNTADMAQAGVDNTQNNTAQDTGMNQNTAAAANPYYQNQAPQANPYYQQTQAPMAQPSMSDVIFGTTSNERFVRGLIFGAAATYLLTNEKAQKAMIKTGMKLYATVAGGVEEMKEKVMDAKAEMESEAMQEGTHE